MSMVYFYFFLSYGHPTLSIVWFLLFEGFPNKYLNLIEVVSWKKYVCGSRKEVRGE